MDKEVKPEKGGSNEPVTKGKRRPNNNANVLKSKFEGACDDLKGQVFEYTGSKTRQVDQYTNTMKALVTYVGRHYDWLVAKAIQRLEAPTVEEPEDPPDGASETERKKWEKRYNMYLSEEKTLKKELKSVHALVWGQCSDTMQSRLQEMNDFDRVDQTMDVIGLLRLIKNVVFEYQTHEHPVVAIRKSNYQFYKLTQGRNESVQKYADSFQGMVGVLDAIKVSVGQDPGLIEHVLREQGLTILTADAAQLNDAKVKAKDWYLAVSLLLGADRHRFGELIDELDNDQLKGIDSYPKTMTECMQLLNHWSSKIKPDGGSTGVAFTNVDDMTQCMFVNNNKDKYTGPACERCGRTNHGTASCIAKTHVNGTVLLLISTDTAGSDEIVFAQQSSNPIPNHWVLLDNQSTVDVFSNPALLTDIYTSDESLTVQCNAGITHTSQRGSLPGYGEVWYNPHGIANILSLSRVKNRFKVSFDSTRGNVFTVHGDGIEYEFRESAKGLYFMDGIAFQGTGEVALVNTVADNRSNYSQHDYRQAQLARRLQITAGRPSTKTLIDMINKKAIKNCPVTPQEVLLAEKIFGPDLGSLKGKTVRHTPFAVRVPHTPIPPEIMSQYGTVTLCIDVMRVNKIPFLITISKHICFGTCERLPDLKEKTLFTSIHNVCKIYRQRGFRVSFVRADNEFSPMRADLAALGIQLNDVGRDEHVPEVERYIRTVKERCRSVYNMLPFRHYPPMLVCELVSHSVFWLNMFPSRGGIGHHTPAFLIAGRDLDYRKHCQLEFGEYVQTHEEHDNSMLPRTIGALALRPTGNAQGGYYFLSLSTGRRISRRAWTALPMPDEVISQVHRMARRSHATRSIVFHTDPGIPINDDVASDVDSDDDSDDATYLPPGLPAGVGAGADNNDDIDNSSDSSSEDGRSDDESDNESADDKSSEDDRSDTDDENEDDSSSGDDRSDETDDSNDINQNSVDSDDTDDRSVSESSQTDDSDDAENRSVSESSQTNGEIIDMPDPDLPDDELPRQAGHIQLRPRKPVNYKNLHNGDSIIMATVETGPEGVEFHESTYILSDDMCDVTLVTPQMSLKQGLATFGRRGEDAVGGELKQVHNMKGFIPRHRHQLSMSERKRALRYLMYLKEKRNGTIKARGCADGRKQRLWTDKRETSSPTVALGSLILTCVIDAHENRKVGTLDVPGAFLQTSMDGEEIVHVLLEGRMAELMVKVDPSLYSEYLFYHNGKAQLYVELGRALYGTLKAALLFWADLTKTLVNMGFIINPYDWCVANKTIDGTQCTIAWHVDDLKISHAKQSVIESITEQLNQRYGKLSPLTTQFGTKHDYLGMIIKYPGDGSVEIDMSDYVEGVLADAHDDMSGYAETPAAEHLFKISDAAGSLSTDKAEYFHHMVAKLLFLCKRGRPDIQTAIAFLCTRVKSPDEDDYKKLCRVIKYLRKHPSLTLHLRADCLTKPQWWIDGAFAVHEDMRSHTGGYFSLGTGAMFGCSTKQKLNTKSSTEAELVAVDDVMGQVMWTQYFLEAQGYAMSPATIYQDNKSAILLEQNGRGSSGKCTRHVNIRYFFVADRVAKGEVKVEYCSTHAMIGDYFTKPLQGAKFKGFRAIIMGESAHGGVASNSTTPGAQECVGNEIVIGEMSGTDRQKGGHRATSSWSDVVRYGLRS